MASSTSEKDYPYRALHMFTPKVNEPYAVGLMPGTEGKVLTERNQNGWIKVSISRSDAQGWVPRAYIQIGTQRKFGDRVFVHDFPHITATNLTFNHGNLNTMNSLEKAIRGFGRALKARQNELPFINHEMRTMLNNDNQREAYITKFLQDMSSRYIEVALKPDCTIGDFTKRVTQVNPGNQEPGFYARVTSDFAAYYSNRAPEFYIGKTGAGFYKRLETHRHPSADDMTPKAQSVRAAKHCDMYIICKSTGNDIYVAFCEQALIEINGSQFHKISSSGTQTAISGPGSMQDFVKTYTKRESAQILRDISSAAFQQVGFVPLCRRQSFGVSAGLNYDSPIRAGEFREKTLWIKTVRPGVKQTFHRPSSKFHLETGLRRVRVLTGKRYQDTDYQTVNFDLMLAKDQAGPAAGVTVYIVFEIMINGQPHAFPYARVPDVGGWSDWSYANCLGVKLEWSVDGQWYERYLQRNRIRVFARTDDEGCHESYVEAMGVIRYLQQVGIEDPKGWFIDFGLARVKELTWDHLTQTAHLREKAPDGQNMPKATIKPKPALVAEIANLGGRNVNGSWRIFPDVPGPKKRGSGTRKKCDGCYIDDWYLGGVKVPGNKPMGQWGCNQHRLPDGSLLDTCSNCYFKGTVCSWTPTELISPALIAGLNYKEYTANDVIPVTLDAKDLDLN